jgi:tRNA pseudouridine55 synthase
MNTVVNLNKKTAVSSHDAVTSVKKLFKVRKAGHAGTLDPLATGVLLVCLNEATKIAGLLSNLDKEYIMTAKLGEETDTYDAEGAVTSRVEGFDISISEIKDILQGFMGYTEQIPPMYSALKHQGHALYELARKGIEVERKPRLVLINSIEILSYESPFLTIRVSCSKGTYIRSLCHDMGRKLGIGAHVTGLIRTRIGHFRIEDSADISKLPHKKNALYTIDDSLRHLPEIIISEDNLKKAKNGNPIKFDKELDEALIVKLKNTDGRIFGIGKTSHDLIKIERLLNL